jgi:hypothetical protein
MDSPSPRPKWLECQYLRRKRSTIRTDRRYRLGTTFRRAPRNIGASFGFYTGVGRCTWSPRIGRETFGSRSVDSVRDSSSEPPIFKRSGLTYCRMCAKAVYQPTNGNARTLTDVLA